MNKSLTSNQLSILIVLSSLAMKISILPGFMSGMVGTDIWIISLTIFIIEIISLYCILLVSKRYPDKTFFQIVNDTLGFPIRKIIEVVFLTYFLIKTVLIVYESEIFIKITMYEQFNEWIFLSVFLLFIFYVSMKDYKILGRVGEILIYCAIIASVVSLMLSIIEVNISNILPIMKNGLLPLIDCYGKSGFWFGDYLIFFLLMGNVKFEKSSIKRIMIYYIVMSLFIILFFLTFVCLFKNTASNHLAAISDVGHYYPRFNNFRIDWISDILWIVIILFSSGMYLYFSRLIFCKTFKLKEKNFILPIIFMIVVFVLLNVIRIPVNDYVNFITKYCLWLPLIISQMPLLLIICSLIAKRRKIYANANEK